MSDRDALIAAILAQPDEDTPRLVLADWLDEHGDAPRAEFIRVQCELARQCGSGESLLDHLGAAGPDGVPWWRHWLRHDTEERSALAKREEALLRAHEAEWKGDLPAYARNTNTASWVRFRRGFVQRVRSSLGPLMKSPAALWKRHPVESLWLERLDGPAGLKVTACRHLGAVRELQLDGERFDAALLGPFTTCPHLANLRVLDLSNGVMSNDGATALARSPMRPAALRLVCRELTPAQFTALLNSPFAARLRRFSPAGVPAWGAAAVADAPLPELRFLDFSMCGAAGVDALVRSKHRLVALKLGSDLTHAAIEPLAAWPALEEVKALHLGGNRVGERGIAALVRSPFFRPHYLDLVGTNAGDGGAKELAAWPGLAGVIDLRLSTAKVGDAGARALAASPHWRDVRHVALYGNKISEPAFARLRARFREFGIDIDRK